MSPLSENYQNTLAGHIPLGSLTDEDQHDFQTTLFTDPSLTNFELAQRISMLGLFGKPEPMAFTPSDFAKLFNSALPFCRKSDSLKTRIQQIYESVVAKFVIDPSVTDEALMLLFTIRAKSIIHNSFSLLKKSQL